VPDRIEGRILCRGPSVATAYYENESATRLAVQRGWLDTGDLGYSSGGELFVTGRRKDLIVRAGRNLHAEDVERAASGANGVRDGDTCAFASTDLRRGTERLVVVVESAVASAGQSFAPVELQTTIRQRVMQSTGATPDEVLIVPTDTIRRTASGKIRRGATRDAFENGTLLRGRAHRGAQLRSFAYSLAAPAMRRGLRSASKWGFAVYAWTALVLVVPSLLLVWLPVSRGARWRILRCAGGALTRLTGTSIGVEGALPPASVPAVVVANHPSFVDAMVLVLASPDPLTFVTSTDFASKPLIGSFLRRVGCLFVARGQPQRATADVDLLARAVRNGRRLAIFPEGSLTRAPGLRPFHLGAFAVAASTEAVIVPVAIGGTRAVVRPGSYMPRRSAVRAVVASPISPPSPSFRAEVGAAEVARGRIAALLGEPLVQSTG
jgi:1-acyl-sn-glycerol-3-phosphate acyltransferase